MPNRAAAIHVAPSAPGAALLRRATAVPPEPSKPGTGKMAQAKTTPKSLRTRRRILDAAMRLFAERGYHASSNADVAEAADLTRGAMLYHFPSREALVEAATAYIHAARVTLLAAAADQPPAGVDLAEHAIDAYWALLREPAFVAAGDGAHRARLVDASELELYDALVGVLAR